MTVVSNHIYKTAPLWAHGHVVSADCTQRKLSRLWECCMSWTVLFVSCRIVLESLSIFNLSFKSISPCSISWVCSDMRGIAAWGRGVGEERFFFGILTFEEREVCWVHCSDFGAPLIFDALSEETRKRAAKAEKRWVRTPTLMTETSPAGLYIGDHYFNVWYLVKRESKMKRDTT